MTPSPNFRTREFTARHPVQCAGRDVVDSKLLQIVHSPGDDAFVCSSQVESTHQGVEWHVWERRSGLMQDIHISGMRAGVEDDDTLTLYMNREEALIHQEFVGVPSSLVVLTHMTRKARFVFGDTRALR